MHCKLLLGPLITRISPDTINDLRQQVQEVQAEFSPDENVNAELCKCLNSHSHVIRRSSLQLLTSPWFKQPTTEEVYKRCLVAELVPLSVQGVRERVLRIGRVGQVVRDGDKEGAGGCVRWLLGKFIWLACIRCNQTKPNLNKSTLNRPTQSQSPTYMEPSSSSDCFSGFKVP